MKRLLPFLLVTLVFRVNAQDQTINGNLTIGGLESQSGYAKGIYFQGNSDPFWLNRYNIADNQSELRLNLSDDLQAEDKFVIGTSQAQWIPHFSVQTNGRVGINTANPVSELQVKGQTGFDSATRFYLTNNAGAYGRTNLVLTGRFHDNNDAWTFGTGARNSIVFSQNLSESYQGIGETGVEKYSIQLEGKSNSLGFLSTTNGHAPNMVLTQEGHLGLGTVNPAQKLDVVGNGRISGGLSVGNNINPSGGLSVGLIAENYTPTTGNWTTAGSTLLLNADDYSTLGFHDSGHRVDFIRAGAGVIQLGYNGGWGEASIGLPGGGVWNSGGNVGIGTTDTKGYKLAIAGKVIAEEIKVKLQSAWPDYVFSKKYELSPLADVEKYVKENNHLPEIPSAHEVQSEGVNLGEMNSKLLKKVEELTLYLIEQNKKIELQGEKIEVLEKELRRKKN